MAGAPRQPPVLLRQAGSRERVGRIPSPDKRTSEDRAPEGKSGDGLPLSAKGTAERKV